MDKNGAKKEIIKKSESSKEKEKGKILKKEEKANVNNKEKKSHKVLKVILIIIGVLVILYFIFAIRNCIIIKDIMEKANNYKDIENYSYEYIGYMDGKAQSKCKVVSKDGTKRVDIENLEDPNRSMIIWKDDNTGESIISIPSTKSAQINNVNGVAANIPFEYGNIEPEVNALGLFALIYSDEYNGKDCYVIRIANDYSKWIEKDTGLVLKIESGPNFKTEITNVNTGNIPEIYKPDLTGYNITRDGE